MLKSVHLNCKREQQRSLTKRLLMPCIESRKAGLERDFKKAIMERDIRLDLRSGVAITARGRGISLLIVTNSSGKSKSLERRRRRRSILESQSQSSEFPLEEKVNRGSLEHGMVELLTRFLFQWVRVPQAR
jgi:hypothetical protein